VLLSVPLVAVICTRIASEPLEPAVGEVGTVPIVHVTVVGAVLEGAVHVGLVPETMTWPPWRLSVTTTFDCVDPVLLE
jgi:hypothetical protein